MGTAELKRYRSIIADSVRWEGFRFRDDDIVISTPPKSGTTWTQMMCALLVLDTLELDRPLASISPWLDMQTNSVADVFALLEAQEHRRIIKTHTPLDGIPLDDRVTYVCVGRDPRDAGLSWEHHMANLDFTALLEAREKAVGLDDLGEFELPMPPLDDPVERFWTWATADVEGLAVTLPRILDHLGTFWDHRHDPNVALFHYADYKADLPGQVTRLAGVLGIPVSDGRAQAIADAVSFSRMKEQADRYAPDVHNRIWQSTESFFHKGTNGQWRDVLDDDGQRRYDALVAERIDPDLAAWAHQGWLGSGLAP